MGILTCVSWFSIYGKEIVKEIIVKNYSKRWKQRNKLKNINEILEEVFSVKDYIDYEMANEKHIKNWIN